MTKLKATLSQALGRAVSVYNAGELAEAEQLCQQIIDVKSDLFDALHLLALIQTRLGKKDTALTSFDRALIVRPDYAEALSNRGLTLHELKRFEEALTSYDRALAVRPDYAEALYNRGNTLHGLRRYEEALTSYDRALAERPNYAEALYNRGLTLNELKRFEEALTSYDRALAVRPDYAEAHWNEALLRLLTGDFSRGWVKYEWRWKNESLAPRKRNFSQTLWLGAEALDGKTILLHSEQGFGDTIQFCRYVPLVAARGARVILEVPRPLSKLMSPLSGAEQIVSNGDPLPDFDIHCPLLSLPLAFGTRLETIPSATPYLRASSQSLMNWDTRLGPRRHPRIGLAWSGSPMNRNDQNRSIGLSSLLPLLDIEATFVSLQKDVRTDDVTVLNDQTDLLHFGDALEDFSDTAALISTLDLVISVDTSIAHLAGALAKPVWVLLPFIPDWRWLLDRDDSPWYPRARLFRQNEPRAWDAVIARIHAALYELVKCRL
jgi:Tfp pilus assembly protein PilF